VITTEEKQVDMQRYIIALIGTSSLTNCKMILFYARIFELEKESSVYI
jgi:hypothetical protein